MVGLMYSFILLLLFNAIDHTTSHTLKKLRIHIDGDIVEYNVTRNGNSLYSDAKVVVTNHPKLMELQGPFECKGDECENKDMKQNAAVSFICFEMAKILLDDIREKIDNATRGESILHDTSTSQKLREAITYSLIDINPYHCGESVAKKMASNIVSSQLRLILRSYELLDVMRNAKFKQFLSLLTMSLKYSQDFDIHPYEDLEKGLQKYSKLYKHTFGHFEEINYGAISKLLTAEMDSLASESNEVIEGGLIHADGVFSAIEPSEAKRECYVSMILSASRLSLQSHFSFKALEIGFNGGHSAAMLLSLTVPQKQSSVPSLVHLDAFDLCQHVYTKNAARIIDEAFPNHFKLTCGDSGVTLWDKVNQQSDARDDLYDFSFVDGSHYKEGALSDLRAARLLSKKGSIVVVDDCFADEVVEAWWTVVDAGEVIPLNQGLCWKDICIGTWA